MTKLMDEAIDALRRKVPRDRQDDVARIVLQLTAGEHVISPLTPEEEADLDESEAAEARGEFATDEQVRAIWAKYGL